MLLQNKWISFVNLCIYLMCFVSGGHKLCSYIMVYSTEHCMVKSFTDTEGKSSASLYLIYLCVRYFVMYYYSFICRPSYFSGHQTMCFHKDTSHQNISSNFFYNIYTYIKTDYMFECEVCVIQSEKYIPRLFCPIDTLVHFVSFLSFGE